MNLAEDVDDVLIPDALEYYLGLNEDMFDGEGMDDDDSDPEEGEDGSDEEKDKKPKKKGGEKKPEAGPAGAGGEKPECKQQ